MIDTCTLLIRQITSQLGDRPRIALLALDHGRRELTLVVAEGEVKPIKDYFDQMHLIAQPKHIVPIPPGTSTMTELLQDLHHALAPVHVIYSGCSCCCGWENARESLLKGIPCPVS